MNRFLKTGLFLLLIGCGAAENSRDEDTPNQKPQRPTAESEREFDPLERSMIKRSKATTRITYLEEINFLKSSTGIPVSYQPTPTPKADASSVATVIDDIPAARIATNCGVTTEEIITVEQKILDCQTKIGQRSATIWSAFANGVSGEGNWFLVSYIDKKKVWQDASTGLLWSDVVDVADFVTALGKNPDDLEEVIQNVCRSVDGENAPSLGNFPAKQVKWRLPNREEFLQADINGARNVLKVTDQGVDLEFWTASYHTGFGGEHMAWSITQKTGVLKSTKITSDLNVRCIGVVTE